MTHLCISSTARGAFNFGYEVTVAADLVQAAAPAAVGDLFAVVVPNASDIPD